MDTGPGRGVLMIIEIAGIIKINANKSIDTIRI